LAIFDPAIAAEKLVGQNLGYAYSNLPSLRQLLISKDDAQNGKFDLVIKANRTFDQLDMADTQVIDLDSMD
jgi:GDP-mannose 6-dehydrogenase